MIRRKAVEERVLVEENLAKLVDVDGVKEINGHVAKEGREQREQVWWETWKEMGCDVDMGNHEIWPVQKVRRGVTGHL
jgi:hypothetical protein